VRWSNAVTKCDLLIETFVSVYNSQRKKSQAQTDLATGKRSRQRLVLGTRLAGLVVVMVRSVDQATRAK
jgi:hypothetical protein